MFRTVFFS